MQIESFQWNRLSFILLRMASDFRGKRRKKRETSSVWSLDTLESAAIAWWFFVYNKIAGFGGWWIQTKQPFRGTI